MNAWIKTTLMVYKAFLKTTFTLRGWSEIIYESIITYVIVLILSITVSVHMPCGMQFYLLMIILELCRAVNEIRCSGLRLTWTPRSLHSCSQLLESVHTERNSARTQTCAGAVERDGKLYCFIIFIFQDDETMHRFRRKQRRKGIISQHQTFSVLGFFSTDVALWSQITTVVK